MSTKKLFDEKLPVEKKQNKKNFSNVCLRLPEFKDGNWIKQKNSLCFEKQKNSEK